MRGVAGCPRWNGEGEAQTRTRGKSFPRKIREVWPENSLTLTNFLVRSKIDKCSKSLRGRSVSILRRMSVFALLAVWLVATQYCGMEAAGIWDSASDSSGCCSEPGPCSKDGCEVVERGAFASSSVLKVPAPEFQACTCMLCARLLVPALIIEPSAKFADGMERPAAWVPEWHFERRTALSPRAPSLIQA